MTARIVLFPKVRQAAGAEPPGPPSAIDECTRMSVLELAAAGFRFVRATRTEVVLSHDRYGELRLANGLARS